MSTLFKTIAAVAFSLATGLSSHVYAAGAQGDPLLVTAIGQATKSSLALKAWQNGCRAVTETALASGYEGNCFGFPSEALSGFEFDRHGRLIRSRILFADADWAKARIRQLTVLRGAPKEVVTASRLNGRVLEWRIGGERWRFEEEGTEGEWMLVRELLHPEDLPEPAELPSIFPEPQPYYPAVMAWDDRYY